MLGQGHWGDVIITESPHMSRKGVVMSEANVCLVDGCEKPVLLMGRCRGHAQIEIYNYRRQDEPHTQVECTDPTCKRGVRPRDALAGMCPTCAEAELERLRRIEAAALCGQTREVAATRFRAMAREFLLSKDRAPLFAIADALEAKP